MIHQKCVIKGIRILYFRSHRQLVPPDACTLKREEDESGNVRTSENHSIDDIPNPSSARTRQRSSPVSRPSTTVCNALSLRNGDEDWKARLQRQEDRSEYIRRRKHLLLKSWAQPCMSSTNSHTNTRTHTGTYTDTDTQTHRQILTRISSRAALVSSCNAKILSGCEGIPVSLAFKRAPSSSAGNALYGWKTAR